MNKEIKLDYTCPCCGYKTFDEPPGSYSICEICYWEDDAVQLMFLGSGGANINLIDAQKNFQADGAKEKRFTPQMEKILSKYKKDPLWRPVDLEKDKDRLKPWESGIDYFNAAASDDGDINKLYYWLS